MDDFLGLAIGLLVTGIVYWLLSGSVFPLLIVIAVIWVCGCFCDGLTGGGRR